MLKFQVPFLLENLKQHKVRLFRQFFEIFLIFKSFSARNLKHNLFTLSFGNKFIVFLVVKMLLITENFIICNRVIFNLLEYSDFMRKIIFKTLRDLKLTVVWTKFSWCYLTTKLSRIGMKHLTPNVFFFLKSPMFCKNMFIN